MYPNDNRNYNYNINMFRLASKATFDGVLSVFLAIFDSIMKVSLENISSITDKMAKLPTQMAKTSKIIK